MLLFSDDYLSTSKAVDIPRLDESGVQIASTKIKIFFGSPRTSRETVRR
jgi:tripartite-type tricarboxylate transporter receptor subunit TctC